MEGLVEQLVDSGYERVAQVTTRGQFAVRGGIVDLYSWQAQLPFRLEFFGDEIESLREFDIDTQTSVRDLAGTDILLGTQGTAVSSPPRRPEDRASLIDDESGTVRDYLAADHLQIDVEPDNNSSAHIQISEAWIETGPEDFSGAFQDCEVGEFGVGDLVLAEAKRSQFVERLSISSKELSPTDFASRQPISSSSRLQNCLDALPPTRAGACVVRNVIAHRSISVN